jgi:hypothetical protein
MSRRSKRRPIHFGLCLNAYERSALEMVAGELGLTRSAVLRLGLRKLRISVERRR